jgi:hypothetical protein
MYNNTNIKVPKKYQHMVREIGKEADGYYAYSQDGYYFKDTDCHSAFEDTQRQLLLTIKSLDKCTCEECI